MKKLLPKRLTLRPESIRILELRLDQLRNVDGAGLRPRAYETVTNCECPDQN